AVIVGVALDLQIDDPDRVAGTPRGLCNQFEAQWLEAQKDVGVKQRTWVNEKQSHLDLPESRGLSGCLVVPLPWSFFFASSISITLRSDQRSSSAARQRPRRMRDQGSRSGPCIAAKAAHACPLLVIFVRPTRFRRSRHVRFAPKADK